jgi:hypothetical protein
MMNISSSNDILLAVNQQSLPFILKRLDNEQFNNIDGLTSTCKHNLREILRDFYTKRIDLNFANIRCGSELNPRVTYREKGWQLRMLKSEINKVFTLGYGDYLLALGETECYIPHNNYDQNPDCLKLIAGKKHSIKLIQQNIYKNYDLKTKVYPTVPLHLDCQHIIVKVPDRR